MSTDLKNAESQEVEHNVHSKDKSAGTINNLRKPILLSSQRFNKIINNAKIGDRSVPPAETLEERKRLKAGNDELVAHFKGSMQRTQEQKLQQIKEQMDKKLKQDFANYEHAKESEAKKRHENIVKAEQIIERLKPGTRELHSAVLQSEVLRARNVQRNINEEFEKAIKKQEYESKKYCNEQALNWIEEEQQRLNERQMNTNAYKKELLQTINENQKQRLEQKKQMIKEQQAAREATDMETKAQIEKQKAVMEKKKQALRKNALEAMKMVEQRRLRDRMVEGLEDRLCCVYNTGKSKADALRSEQSKKLAEEQQQMIDAEVRKLTNLENTSNAMESERIRRDITTMQLKFTAEEQEKVRKDKAAKQARIEAYLKEMQHQKEMQQTMEEEKRLEISQRLKNAEVNYLFAEKEKERKLKQFQKVRSELNQQIDDHKRHQFALKETTLSYSDAAVDKEHKYFFEHARNLMEDAQQKGRPLYPFVKVVNQYKRHNQIDCDDKLAKHLQSNITFGGNNTKYSVKKDENENGRQNSTRENILQNCLKINEIVKAAHSTQGDKINLENSIEDGCTSRQFRYSMDELKKLNQFSAPICH